MLCEPGSNAAVLWPGSDGAVKLGDFGLAEVAAELAEEQADRSNLVGKGRPSSGFHKKFLVRCWAAQSHSVLSSCLGSDACTSQQHKSKGAAQCKPRYGGGPHGSCDSDSAAQLASAPSVWLS